MGVPFLNELKIITDEQVAGWHVNYADESAEGPCPACGDHTKAAFVREAVSMAVAEEPAPKVPGFTRLFQCKCGQTHMDGSVARKNCGRGWLVKVRPEGALPPLVAANDYSLLVAATALSEDDPKQAGVKEQSQIKASAEKWTAGVTALFSLFGLGGLVVGKDTVASLGTTGKALTGVALLFAVGLAAWAVMLSYRAAYGWPKVVNLEKDEELVGWYTKRQAYGERAAGFLHLSVWFAGGALVALLTAVGFVWYMPGSAPATPKLQLTFTNGAHPCGELIDSSVNGQLTIQLSSGMPTSEPAAKLIKSVGVTSCP